MAGTVALLIEIIFYWYEKKQFSDSSQKKFKELMNLSCG